MSNTIYRLNLWRFGSFKIKEFEVVKKTSRTVVVKMFDSDGMAGGYYESRYALVSRNYLFFDNLEDANRAAENVITERLRYEESRVDELRIRLQEVCRHKAITSPIKGGRCVRCDFAVPNPEDYTSGGG